MSSKIFHVWVVEDYKNKTMKIKAETDREAFDLFKSHYPDLPDNVAIGTADITVTHDVTGL